MSPPANLHLMELIMTRMRMARWRLSSVMMPSFSFWPSPSSSSSSSSSWFQFSLKYFLPPPLFFLVCVADCLDLIAPRPHIQTRPDVFKRLDKLAPSDEWWTIYLFKKENTRATRSSIICFFQTKNKNTTTARRSVLNCRDWNIHIYCIFLKIILRPNYQS